MKTEELKTRVKELNDYFVEKLINGEYEVEERSSYTVMVNIDSYKFNIWISNGEMNVKTYGLGFDGNFMELFFNEGQKSIIYKKLMEDGSRIALMEEIKNKEREVEQLKSRLSRL